MGSIDSHAREIAQRMREACASLTNEAELRRHVEPALEAALTDLYSFSFREIRSERRNAAGDFDVMYGGVVVEFEWEMDRARRRHGAQQALDYLRAEREAGGSDAFTAVVTDGRQWGFLVRDEESSDLFHQSRHPEDAFVWRENSPEATRRFLELVSSHAQLPLSGASLTAELGTGSDTSRRAISELLATLRTRDPADRVDTLYSEWRRSLEVAYGELDDRDAPVLHHVRDAYDVSAPGTLGEFLFALHTYFALVARFTALEILSIAAGEYDSRPSTWGSLSPRQFRETLGSFERGELPRALSIANLLEGDVFGWYVDHLEANISLQQSLQAVCSVFSRFAFPRLAYGSGPTEDILRALYLSLTTRELRGALGEFLTPSWLAEAVLRFAEDQGAKLDSARVLDPTCGTGTFLRAILRERLAPLRMKGADSTSAAEVQATLNSVVGFDINPVAVVAARMNYLIMLGDLAAVGDLFLPVWLADSILLPGPPDVQVEALDRPGLAGSKYVELFTSLSRPFVFPTALVNPQALPAISTILQSEIRAITRGEATREEAGRSAVKRVGDLFGPEGAEPLLDSSDAWDEARAVLEFLFDQLAELEEKGKNGVWAEIIENRFAPAMLGTFDLVIGNPPWLSWKKLPDEWKEKAESLWRNYGLFTAPSVPGVDPLRSYQSSDLATLVFAIALERYARPDGMVAFLVPKALANGTAANRALRTYHLSSDRDAAARKKVDLPFKLLTIQDFEDVNPFSPDAQNRPMVLIARPAQKTEFPIKGAKWARRRSQAIPDAPWSTVRSAHLEQLDVLWQPISSFDPSPLAWWLPTEEPIRRPPTNLVFGEGFNTRGAAGVYHVELLGHVDPSTGLIRLRNQPDAGRKEVPEVTSLAPASLVLPVLRGQDVDRWETNPSGFVLIPHDPSDRSRPLDSQELQGEYPEAYRYFRRFRSVLRERPEYYNFRLSDDQWWHVGSVSQLGADGTLLCFPEIAYPPGAAVLRPVWIEELGRSVLPIPNHKVNFYRAADPREAYYLAALLNSSLIQEILSRYAIYTSLSAQTLRYLPIPSFDPNLVTHLTIADLSQRIHDSNPDERELLVRDLEEKVQELIGPLEVHVH